MHDLSSGLGALLPVYWGIPFVGMLLSIAVCPLLVPHFWHNNFGKISLFWGLLFLVPFAVTQGIRLDSFALGSQLAFYEFMHTMLSEYLPFMVLLFSLFTVAGGIRLKGCLAGTPAINTAILLLGTLLASWMGTTGAAMFLIRPLLRANEHRRYKAHTVIFFIFLVANIGGALTPLGDPPLFLGFLAGVHFFWTLQHLFLPTLILASILLTLFFLLDSRLYAKEGRPRCPVSSKNERLGFEGLANFPLLLGIVGIVFLSGIWKPNVTFTVFEVPVELQSIVRDALLLLLAAASWLLTSRESRARNGFTWAPIQEVAKLFWGIFISMIPVLAILKAGKDGALGGFVEMVYSDGQPHNAMFFWLTGAFSSFLDNAPTYLVFFNTAAGMSGQAAPAAYLMSDWATTLAAISAGAVYMGANTYIGNAPNFMVRSIAEDSGVNMPSFFGYMLWSAGILLPLFLLLTWIFF